MHGSEAIRQHMSQRARWTISPGIRLTMTDNLDKTKITGNDSIDSVQDGVNKGVTGQFEKGGALEGVGKLTSAEIFTRSERGGKNTDGKLGL